jgi:hypothetical protein
MSFQVLVFLTFALGSQAAFHHAGSDASAARNTQPNSDETETNVVSADVADDIKQRQMRRRALRAAKESKLQAVRDEADARALQAMEAARNATLAADRAAHKYHEQMHPTEPPPVPSVTVVHLVHVPHKRNHTNHTSHKNRTNQTMVPMNSSDAVVPTNRSDAVVQKPPLSKALASKNVSHTIAHANASRMNVTKAVARHKNKMTEKASDISNATRAAASKGVTSAFHAARLAAEKLRKNHLAKRATIAKERKDTSDEDTFEERQKEKIKKNVIEAEGDELAEALKGVLSFPAQVPATTTTTTTTTTTVTTTTVTTTTSTVATTTSSTVATTTSSTNVTSTNASAVVAVQNITKGNAFTANEAGKDATEAELMKTEADIEKAKAEKQKAIEKDDLETALALKKELASLEKKRDALEAHAAVPAPNSTASIEAAVNKTGKSEEEAASKLRGSHD